MELPPPAPTPTIKSNLPFLAISIPIWPQAIAGSKITWSEISTPITSLFNGGSFLYENFNGEPSFTLKQL